MQNNRQLRIATGNSRKATHWPASTIWWEEFCAKLRTPVRSIETITDYLGMPKSQQDELKDVGGFVGGTFAGERRKAATVEGRDLVTLDLDHVPPGGTADIIRRVDGLGCAAVIYSTRKHTDFAPRVRVVVPLNETCSADEYEPIARKLAEMIGIELCDPTTFEASRLMYWPSVSANAPYVCEAFDKPFLYKDGMLGLYADWHDVVSWPQVPGVEALDKKRAAKQQDPLTKQGVIGAFCRTYDILHAMEKFLPGLYEPTDTPNRFTYTGGSTTGGAVLYQDGLFLYSHHATDPCSGQLVNAWDLVRLHKFGEKDDAAQPGTPTNKLPSYIAMCDLATSDETTRNLLAQERYSAAADVFENAPAIQHTDWMKSLEVDRSGNYAKTINNIILILENDENLSGKFITDDFRRCGLVIDKMPWDAHPFTKQRRWRDADDAGLRWYLETRYNIVAKEKTYDATSIVGHRKKINVVKEYLQSLIWDGKARLDTLFVDYLGAKDNIYTRAVTRKTLCAAVARAVQDDVKFDNMPIIIGGQGIGKSTMLSYLGKEWFSDSLTTFEGKEAAEMIQGTWINEVGELTAMYRREMNSVKQFLSKRHDIYRAAYGRQTDEYPRRCVFIGTSNRSDDILSDETGNRRFWPIETELQEKTKNVWDDLPGEVDQIWAEAYFRFMLGEKLILSPEEEKLAREEQAKHEDVDELEGVIEAFLDKPIPKNWYELSDQVRRGFIVDGEPVDGVELVQRTKVCAREIYFECLGKYNQDNDPRLTRRIHIALKRLKHWKASKSVIEFPPYGRQRAYYRKTEVIEDG